MPSDNEMRELDIALTSEAINAGMVDPLCIVLISRENLSVGGARQAVESLREAKPHLFNKQPSEPSGAEASAGISTADTNTASERSQRVRAKVDEIVEKHGFDSPEYRALQAAYVNGRPILDEDKETGKYDFIPPKQRAKIESQQVPPPPGRAPAVDSPGSPEYEKARAQFVRNDRNRDQRFKDYWGITNP